MTHEYRAKLKTINNKTTHCVMFVAMNIQGWFLSDRRTRLLHNPRSKQLHKFVTRVWQRGNTETTQLEGDWCTRRWCTYVYVYARNLMRIARNSLFFVEKERNFDSHRFSVCMYKNEWKQFCCSFPFQFTITVRALPNSVRHKRLSSRPTSYFYLYIFTGVTQK